MDAIETMMDGTLTHWSERLLERLDDTPHPTRDDMREVHAAEAIERFYRLNRTSAIRAEREAETDNR
jgi:hypothetical protein